MINCYAKLYKVKDVLEAGFPNRETFNLSAETPVWQSPAFMASPSRTWQNQSAVEGVAIMNLHIHTRTNLADINIVEISAGTVYAGTWYVQQPGSNGDGVNWNILLARRPLAAAA